MAWNVFGQQHPFHPLGLLCTAGVDANHAGARVVGKFEGAKEHAVKTEIIDKGFTAKGPVHGLELGAGDTDTGPLFHGSVPALTQGPRRLYHCVHDFYIAGTAAEMKTERLFNLFPGGIRIFGQQVFSSG